MIHKQIFGHLVSVERDTASWTAIGMSASKGASPAIFTRWFHVFRRGTCSSGASFLDFHETMHGHELNKKSGEASPGPMDCCAYIIMLLVQVDLSAMSIGAL